MCSNTSAIANALKSLLVAAALVSATAACDGNDPPPPREATFEGLGDLPGGNFESVAEAVSADGSVVVGYSHSENGVEAEAFRWAADPDGGEGGTMVGLGSVGSWARDVSADGSVVVGSRTNSEDDSEAFRWRDGTCAPRT